MEWLELLFLPMVPFLVLSPWLLRRREVLDPARLRPIAGQALAELRRRLESRLSWLADGRRLAHAARADAREFGRLDGAARALVLELCADLTRDLELWRGAARGLRLALPPEPLRVRDMRLRRLALWAALTHVGHALVTTPAERLRWQLRALDRGVGHLRRVAEATGAGARADARWIAACHDLGVLVEGTLVAYTALLLSQQLRPSSSAT